MGICFSITSFDLVTPFMGYLCCNNLEANLEGLQNIMHKLNEMRDDLYSWVSIEKDRGLQVLPVVKQWISEAEEIESKANRLLDLSMIEIERLSMYGYCSLISASSYEYSKEVDMMLTQVESLLRRGTFEAVAEGPLMEERPVLQLTGSQEKLLQSEWARLMDENVGILGIYGMGGVGKTTLLAYINNRFLEAGVFDVVTFVVVASKEVENIQDEIGRRLGLQWERDTKKEKAAEIFRFLKRKRFVLLLDGLQREVDLEEIGVPYPTRDNGCKILFTSRDRGAFGSKWVDVVFFKVNCLPPQEALNLFQKKVGEITLGSHPDIPALARITAEKCHGLPLALSVVGETMSCKRTTHEWYHAIAVLNSYAYEFSGFEDKILPTLKFSYDNLHGEKLKSCFLYCALFPEDFVIRRQDLVNYWVGEGLISNEFEGYDTISHLVRACLLMENESGVMMEPMVREMALWVASDFGREKDHFVVLAGMALCQMPRVRDWRMVRRMSVTSTNIESISVSPECTQLTTLLLRDNKIQSINVHSFRSMESLLVLDLSHNRELSELPEEISMLVALRYLSLSGTMIKDLPHGLGKLTQLIHLDLEYTLNLQSISIISGLLKLKVLRLYGSAAALDISLLEKLMHLERLTVTVREVDVLKALLGSSLAGCTQGLHLEGLKVSVASFAATFGVFGSLRNLKMVSCDIMESVTDWEGKRRYQYSPSTSFNQITPSDTWFKNLSDVVLLSCKGLRDLTWLIYAANLESLSIKLSPDLEELLNQKKAGGVGVEPFLKLQVLLLDSLNELKSIYWSPLSFPRLKKVDIKNCSNLHKLPLNSTSVAMIDDLDMEVEKEWLQRVEWENEAKERFLPVIRTVSVSQLQPV